MTSRFLIIFENSSSLENLGNIYEQPGTDEIVILAGYIELVRSGMGSLFVKNAEGKDEAVEENFKVDKCLTTAGCSL